MEQKNEREKKKKGRREDVETLLRDREGLACPSGKTHAQGLRTNKATRTEGRKGNQRRRDNNLILSSNQS